MPFWRDAAGIHGSGVVDPAPVAQTAWPLLLFLEVEVACGIAAHLATFEPGKQPCTYIHGATYTQASSIVHPLQRALERDAGAGVRQGRIFSAGRRCLQHFLS